MKRFLLGVGVALALAAPAQAERLVGLTSDNRLALFESTSPSTATFRSIAGLGGDTLLGIDLRATDRRIYALGSSGSIYRLGSGGSTGVTATSLGSITTAINGGNVDLDFNPAANRLRTSSNANQSLRLNPDAPAAAGGTNVDGSYNYATGGAPSIVGVAYLNNRPGATTTRFFALDAARNQLVVVSPPNVGTLTSPLALNGLTLTSDGPVGFDISGGTGAAFVAFGGQLYGLGLGTGNATLLGTLGTGVTDITALAVPEPATWAMMIGGFGAIGAQLRRRSGLKLRVAKAVRA